MIQSSIELSKPIGEKMSNLDKAHFLREDKDTANVLVDVNTIFNYFEKEGDLVLNMSIPKLGLSTWCSIDLSPHDKVDILNYINKDNNRIKSQIEEMQHILKQDVKTCRFCDSTDIEKFMPREEDTAINLCSQHQKYIQRISERINGSQPLV